MIPRSRIISVTTSGRLFVTDPIIVLFPRNDCWRVDWQLLMSGEASLGSTTVGNHLFLAGCGRAFTADNCREKNAVASLNVLWTLPIIWGQMLSDGKGRPATDTVLRNLYGVCVDSDDRSFILSGYISSSNSRK